MPAVERQPSWPRITIVTPSFNQAQYLERTILSVINQNYPNLEYLVYDGGSEDGSVDIVRRYEDKITYWESCKDEGQTHAISKGFERATGDIMAWINSDDFYAPDALSTVAEQFRSNPSVNVIYGDTLIVDEKGTVMRQVCSVPFSKWGFLLNAFALYQPSIFWRRELYNRTDGLDITNELVMDRDLWFQFYKKKAKFKHVKKTLSCCRVHRESKTSRYQNESIRLFNDVRYRMLGINATRPHYRIMRAIMRARTLCWHVLLGNLYYLCREAGRPCHVASCNDWRQ